MDLTVISHSCPLALDELLTWTLRSLSPFDTAFSKHKGAYVVVPSNPRHLYDFFDQQQIFVTIVVEDHSDGMVFRGRLQTAPYFPASEVERATSRSKVESAVFKAAFEWLEAVLSLK